MDQVLWLSLVTGSVAFTLCETTLFAGLRDWVKGRSAWLAAFQWGALCWLMGKAEK